MRKNGRNEYIFALKDTERLQNIGNKARQLRFLAQKKFSTPTTFVCTWKAYERYLENDTEIIGELKTELSETIDEKRRYAVRSSANVEDGLDFSFAGQFKSVLDTIGVDDILHAIWSIWGTVQSPGVQAYLQRNALDTQGLKMAVIVQEMVSPVVSGVAFSRNPMTGLSEIVVEAVRGSGEALVRDGVTPGRWVYKWGEWIVRPEEEDIKLDLIDKVVQQTKAIAKAYGQAVDLEWVYDGQNLYWVQLREITSLNINMYSNSISKEFFPGLIKPLVWSVNVPLVNGAWVNLLTEVLGPNDIDPNSLAKSFYYRAYFNMGALGQIFETLGLPRETLELMMGIETTGPDKPSFKPTFKTYSYLPRMLRVLVDKLRFARKIDAFLPAAKRQYQTFKVNQVDALSVQQLLNEIDRLYSVTQKVAYYNIVTPLLMQTYNAILNGQLKRLGVDFKRFDLTRGLKDLEQFDPNVFLTRLSQAYGSLDETLQARIAASSYDDFCRLSGIESLQAEVREFIEQFGHLSDSGNDFSSVPWRESPDLILSMMINYAPPEDRSQTRVGFEDLEISPVRRLLLEPIYRRARQFRWYREAVGSLYTYGYGLFRIYFLALGDRFVQREILETKEDIFYLSFDEIRDIAEKDGSWAKCGIKIAHVKQAMAKCQAITPPSIVYGDEALPLEIHTADKMRGTPTSRGHYTGPARIIQGIRDFDKLEEGDVLVIPYSDVGWTPLFAKAGAIIAESGGILSHSSIVAREYNIPAVVSVPGACQLEDDMLVTVDGYRGEIVIHQSEE